MAKTTSGEQATETQQKHPNSEIDLSCLKFEVLPSKRGKCLYRENFAAYINLVEGKKERGGTQRTDGMPLMKAYIFDMYSVKAIRERRDLEDINSAIDVYGFELQSSEPKRVGVKMFMRDALNLNAQLYNGVPAATDYYILATPTE